MTVVSNVAVNEWGSKRVLHNDFWDVFCKYGYDKPHDFAKALYVFGVDVPQLLGWMSTDNEAANAFRRHAALFKGLQAPFKILSSTNTALRSTWSYFTGNRIQNGKNDLLSVKTEWTVVKDWLGVVNPISSTADFFSKAIFFIPKQSLLTLKGVNGGILSFLKAPDIANRFHTLGHEKASIDEKTEALLKVINEIALFIFGILTVLTMFTEVSIAASVFTTLIATSVAFTIFDYYRQHYGAEKKLT